MTLATRKPRTLEQPSITTHETQHELGSKTSIPLRVKVHVIGYGLG